MSITLAQTDAILTTKEAIAFAKFRSGSAFYRWAAAIGCKPTMQGRWSKRHLTAALDREALRGVRL